MEVSELINWTIQKAQRLKAEPSDGRGPSIEWLLSIVEPEPAASTVVEAYKNDSIAIPLNLPTADATPIAHSPGELVAISDNMSGAPSDPPEMFRPASEVVDDKSQSDLLRAILAPDIHAAPETRDRAIVLRWVLRDIKSDRVNLSAVSPNNLRILVELDLVEIRNDAVVLTTAGASAIL
jgi:hypothetical protein